MTLKREINHVLIMCACRGFFRVRWKGVTVVNMADSVLTASQNLSNQLRRQINRGRRAYRHSSFKRKSMKQKAPCVFCTTRNIPLLIPIAQCQICNVISQ